MKCGRSEEKLSEARDRELRRLRNCDGFTNPNLTPKGLGLVKQCPNSLEPRAYEAFRWWFEFREYKVLPYAGYDFAGQPHQVCQAIRAGDAGHAKGQRSAQPAKPPPPPKGKR